MVTGDGARVIWPPCHTRRPIRLTGQRATAARVQVAYPTCERVWTVRFPPMPLGERAAWWRPAR